MRSTKDIRSRGRHNRRQPKARPTDNVRDRSRLTRSDRRRNVAYPMFAYPMFVYPMFVYPSCVYLTSDYPRELDASEFNHDSKTDPFLYYPIRNLIAPLLDHSSTSMAHNGVPSSQR